VKNRLNLFIYFMIKIIEAIVVLALLLFAFFIGVKYSDQVKERAGWLFETKEEEIELPNIDSEGNAEIPGEENNQEIIIEDGNSTNNSDAGSLENMDNAPAKSVVPSMNGPKATTK